MFFDIFLVKFLLILFWFVVAMQLLLISYDLLTIFIC